MGDLTQFGVKMIRQFCYLIGKFSWFIHCKTFIFTHPELVSLMELSFRDIMGLQK